MRNFTFRDIPFLASQRSLWTPSQINTALWLDPSDQSTITASSTLADEWRDKKGNGIKATATGSNRPATGTRTINSLNVIDFNNNSSTTHQMILSAVPLAGTTSAMAVYVFQLDSDPPPTPPQAGPVLSDWGGDVSGANHFPWTDGNIYEDFMTSIRKNPGNPVPSMSANACIAAMTSANGLWEVYINGSLLYSTTTNTYAIGSSPTIGRSMAFGLDGRVGEIVVVPNDTSSATRQLLEGYMAGPNRWGLASLLPANHPYRPAAP